MLRALAVTQFLAALSAGATGALLVVLAQDHLQLRERDSGLLVGAIGVGGAGGLRNRHLNGSGDLQLASAGKTPERLRGRIFAAFDMLWQSGRLISLLLGGIAANLFGIRAVFYIGGALLIVAAWTGLKAIRSAT